jgi:D-methionine transport system permease protein
MLMEAIAALRANTGSPSDAATWRLVAKASCSPRPRFVVLGMVVNPARSTPVIILVVAIIPFTRLIAGTSIGSTAAIVPLMTTSTPFITRLVEAAIRKVDASLIETASSFGATPLQIVLKVLIPEALPGLVLALTLAVVDLLG